MFVSFRSALLATVLLVPAARGDELAVVGDVEGQPLAANAERLKQALDFLGSPPRKEFATTLDAAIQAQDAAKVQSALDPHVLLQVTINPESRVKVGRGPAAAVLQQAGFTPVLVKVVNDSPVKAALRVTSPQAGPVYGGAGGATKLPRPTPRPPSASSTWRCSPTSR